ncbi:hypothetical protein PLICRDRAFT_175761 [Plicaturopsis crispa FD-325 SS-3]|nr:hypothetical protein PLICRDRAFT_175761 [Plicaturopsis crispa FD-325 SS-3]
MSSYPFWERIHLASLYEFKKRVNAHPPESGYHLVEPGEIGFCKTGSVNDAYFKHLRRRGFELSPMEVRLERDVKRRGSQGRPCLVLDRIDGGKYVACFLSTFGHVRYGRDLPGSAARFFGIAVGDTPPYPPGVEPIEVTPKWEGDAFLFSIPIVLEPDEVMFTTTGRRHRVSVFELKRIKDLVIRKMKAFDTHHHRLRPVEASYQQKMWSLGGPNRVEWNADDEMSTRNRMTVEHHDNVYQATFERPIKPPQPSDADQSRNVPTTSARHLPRIHFLEVPEQAHDIRYPIHHMQHSMNDASQFLRNYVLPEQTPPPIPVRRFFPPLKGQRRTNLPKLKKLAIRIL